jgi:hypothetical protein
MTVAHTESNTGDGYSGSILYTWVLTTANPTGAAVGPEIAQHTDLCWQATGTWGGATAAIQGSNTDVDANYGAVTNASGGAAITYTADGAPKQQIEKPAFVRPKLTTAGTAASVTVTLFARRNPFSRRS